MKPKCVDAVQSRIGRVLSKAEQTNMDERVQATMRRLASRDPARWQAMPAEERVREAGRVIAEDIRREAELHDRRVALQVEKHAEHVPEVEAAGARGFDVLQSKLLQLSRYVKGVEAQLRAEAIDFLDYATRQDRGSLAGRGVRWLANLHDPQKALAFTRAVYGQDGGDAGANAAAKAWREVADNTRERFNRAGGDIRKLSTAYLPTLHDAGLVRKAGIEAWVDATRKLVDRSRYTTAAGRQLNDLELTEVLERMWREIMSGGLASAELGAFRAEGALANAGSQARSLHFRDGDAYVAYHAQFGEGDAVNAVTSYLHGMARNIAMVESWGPNPAALFRTMKDVATLAGGKDRFALLSTTEAGWNTLRGAYDNPQSQTIARIGQGAREVEVLGKLQGTTLGSLTDVPLYLATLNFNRLPALTGMMNLMRAFGPDMRRFADVAGLMGEGMIADMHAASDSLVGRGWIKGTANATMKLSLLQQVTNATRRALSVTMMNGLAAISRTPWEQLDRYDRARLKTAGFTPDEWAAVQQVQPERWRSSDYLTPQAIMATESIDRPMRERLVARVLGVVTDEAEYASPNPDLRTRTLTAGGLQRGTGFGELHRSTMLFKGFGLTMIFRHWDRLLNADMSPAQRLTYGAHLTLGVTIMGAVVLQLKDLLLGRDPRDVTGNMGESPAQAVKFWTAALAQGGGLGFLGDMLLNGQGRQGQSGASAAIGGVAGPVIGSAFELVYDVGFENLREAAEGKDTHAGAETFRWARGHTPFVNLWYGKLVIDQAVLNSAQEMLSPGYLAKVRGRAEREWGSTWWWELQPSGVFSEQPFEGPQRAPELASAVGER
jgi:hypothetical protein